MVAAQHVAEVLHLTGTLTSLSPSIQSPRLVPAYLSSPCLLTHHAVLLVASIVPFHTSKLLYKLLSPLEIFSYL